MDTGSIRQQIVEIPIRRIERQNQWRYHNFYGGRYFCTTTVITHDIRNGDDSHKFEHLIHVSSGHKWTTHMVKITYTRAMSSKLLLCIVLVAAVLDSVIQSTRLLKEKCKKTCNLLRNVI